MQAMSKNGKIFDNGIMIGVKQCIDKVLRVPTCTLYWNMLVAGTVLTIRVRVMLYAPLLYRLS